MRLPRRLIGAATALASLVGLGACSAEEQEPTFLGLNRITVAMHNDLPGMSYSSNYDRSGLDFHVFHHIKDTLDVAFSEPVDVSSSDRVTQLLEKKADLTIASFSITAERMKKIHFVGPYLTTRQGFLVGPDSDVRSKADLRRSTVCTWDGTTSKSALDEIREVRGVEILPLDDASDCVDQLIAGKVDAVSTDQAILYGFAHRYRKEGLRVVQGVTIGVAQHYGIGLRKGHTADCNHLKEWLMGYVGSSEWTRDIQTSLPALVDQEPGWISNYKPSAARIEARSCRDTVSP
ncbi:transporter substrate-binding domain-containing protein [Streptomyces sp. NPDC051207]|uniref:transporter substrate-binding domain-containing protein n=1 Tax=Streptomyces sp. NPDC051207 TaxID=3154641 RepID=UPI0034240917